MTVTRLKRKDRKNLARAVNKTRVIKQLLARPVIKQVNVEELTAKYGSGAITAAAPVKSAKPAKHEEAAQAETKQAETKHEEAAPAETKHEQEAQEETSAAPLMSAGDMNA